MYIVSVYILYRCAWCGVRGGRPGDSPPDPGTTQGDFMMRLASLIDQMHSRDESADPVLGDKTGYN